MLDSHIVAATVTLASGAATDWVDGYVARKYGATSKLGADVLEPVADLALTFAAVAMLIYVSVWSIWFGVLLIAIPIVLILIHFFRKVRWIRPLKRVQNWLHPFYAVIVMIVALFQYITLAAEMTLVQSVLMFFFGAGVAVAVALKWNRITELFNYQED